MKFIIALFILGVSEIYTIGKLHEILGINGLIILYITTSIIGLAIAFIFYTEFKKVNKNTNYGNKFGKRLKARKATEKDKVKIESLIYTTSYIFGCILIAIPGIITDVLGILLLFPRLGRFVSGLFSHQIYIYSSKNHE